MEREWGRNDEVKYSVLLTGRFAADVTFLILQTF